MTCVAADRRFRLLDAYVGWDSANAAGIEGFDDPGGIRLARRSGGTLSPGAIDPYIPPPRVSQGCDPCTWYLVTPAPPESRLLVLGACDDCWRLVNPHLALADATAIAVDRFHIAVGDRARRRVWIITAGDGRIVGEAQVQEPIAVAFTPDAEIVVASKGARHLLSFDLVGQPLPQRYPPLPAGDVNRLAFGTDCSLWVVMEAGDGTISLYRLKDDATDFAPAALSALIAAFSPLSLVYAGSRGFCIDRGTGSGQSRVVCWTWQGRAADRSRIQMGAAAGLLFEQQGQLLTAAIDSGMPRCRWHRLRIEADVPTGTSVEVSVSSSELPAPPAQGGTNAAPWTAFASGTPYPDDWQSVTAPATEMLIQQPAGRYLFVRVRLTGPGNATPVVRRLRLDFPRATSADLLPVVYREDPDAADFTERFLALFDETLAELDETVTRAPALLDAEGVPNELLSWLGRILGMVLDPGLPAEKRRQLLKAAPILFRRRGTRAALIEAIRLATDLDAVIEEPGLARAWGALGSSTMPPRRDAARLGSLRLFGAGEARLKLGASHLGRARLRSYGNPDLDAHQTGAFQITVGLPAVDAIVRRRVELLVDDLVPGHVLTTIVTARASGFWLLPAAKLAVDTQLRLPVAPVLGSAELRLGRTAILPVRDSHRGGFTTGRAVACGC